MSDHYIDQLSDYLDDELAPAERAAVEAHLASCHECSGTLEELRGVVARAAALPARPPAAELWPGVQ